MRLSRPNGLHAVTAVFHTGAVDITLRRFPVGTLGGVQAIDRDVRGRIRRATAELTGATTALRGGLGLEDLTQVALFEPAARAENEIVLIRRAQGCVTRIAERDIGAPLVAAGVLLADDAAIDAAARRVWRGDDEVRLTPTEFDLLLCLAATPGAVVSRDHLMAEVWDWPGASGTRTVDSHVKGLRAKLGGDLIRTVHGVGYALESGGAT